MMEKIFTIVLLCAAMSASAQTYVWKNGHALIEDPDSITFVKPDMGLQVFDSLDGGTHFDYMFTYPTTDHAGKPCVMSAVLYLNPAQKTSKQIGKMALFNHYTILRSNQAPSAGELFDLQTVGLSKGMPAVLPMSMVTLNDLYNLGINDKDAFLEPLASNMKSWIISKKFSLDEFTELLGTDSIAKFMKPLYCDSTSAEMQRVLSYVDKMRFIDDWTPDADTDVKLYHSLKDDIVAPENSEMMYQWLVSKGVQHAELDMTSLEDAHLDSGTFFMLYAITVDLKDW